MKNSYRLFIFIALMVRATFSYAVTIINCNGEIPVIPRISFAQPVGVSDNIPVGTVIATGTSALQVDVYTDTDVGLAAFIYPFMKVTTPVVMRVNNRPVFSTNLRGIGITYPDNFYDAPGEITFDNIYQNSFGIHDYILKYQLIKTEENIQGGVLSGVYGDFGFYCVPNSNRGPSVQKSFNTSLTVADNTVISEPPCKVTNSDIKVPMGSPALKLFNRKGAVVAPTFFDIPFSCQKSAKVSFTLSPSASGAQDIMNGIINLDNPTASATAKGVGLQVLFNNMPVELNKATPAGTTQQGNFAIRLQAQYIQTLDTASAGTANASATFIISYD